ncbi:hypothetical protein EJV46_13955 [Roseococcus sp. SYP-B2431]|uniref:hypothetical protein n=1 Tax=Roseococcus sp. SYP-B2431 TaxID=2496640 RepID=UPI00103A8824|nr:hypothetical protein [Roseococcus sp. SYP-B2431]TCH98285.1 hypothetical protein EJV46_13955 [Roseococcus sp. SYP-B2431]
MNRRSTLLIAASMMGLAACQQDVRPVTQAAPSPAQGGPHWLVGTWRGPLMPMGTPVVLQVTSVNDAGTRATGRWGATEVDIRLSGSTARFFTSQNNPVELNYAGPSTLQGIVTPRGGAGVSAHGRGNSQWTITMIREIAGA